jgi:hypothetical protein
MNYRRGITKQMSQNDSYNATMVDIHIDWLDEGLTSSPILSVLAMGEVIQPSRILIRYTMPNNVRNQDDSNAPLKGDDVG